MSFRVNNENLLEKNKTIWNTILDLQNIESNPLPVYDARYLKTKVKTWRYTKTNTTCQYI